MDAVTEIKTRVSMRQIVERYGITMERGGYISCPFHMEKTPSLKIYDQPGKGFCCFGCGAAGSVIDFVMRLRGLTFRQAVVRIGMDFGIAVTGSPPSIKDRRKWQIEQFARVLADRARQERIDGLCDEYRLAWFVHQNTEPFSNAWCMAVTRLPKIDYELEELLCTPKRTI